MFQCGEYFNVTVFNRVLLSTDSVDIGWKAPSLDSLKMLFGTSRSGVKEPMVPLEMERDLEVLRKEISECSDVGERGVRIPQVGVFSSEIGV